MIVTITDLLLADLAETECYSNYKQKTNKNIFEIFYFKDLFHCSRILLFIEIRVFPTSSPK